MATTKSSTTLQFTPFSSVVQPPFWHELSRLKIDQWKLSEGVTPVSASYAVGRSIMDRETGKEVDLGCHITVGGDAFDENGQ